MGNLRVFEGVTPEPGIQGVFGDAFLVKAFLAKLNSIFARVEIAFGTRESLLGTFLADVIGRLTRNHTAFATDNGGFPINTHFVHSVVGKSFSGSNGSGRIRNVCIITVILVITILAVLAIVIT